MADAAADLLDDGVEATNLGQEGLVDAALLSRCLVVLICFGDSRSELPVLVAAPHVHLVEGHLADEFLLKDGSLQDQAVRQMRLVPLVFLTAYLCTQS